MRTNINLLPWREAIKEHQKKEFISMLGLALSTVAAGMLVIHFLINRQINFQNDDNNYLKAEIQLLDQQISEIESLQKEKAQLLARMQIIQQLQTNRPQIVRLFDEIIKTIPEGLYLTNLTHTGPHLMMEGRAESNTRVSTFMRNIEASHWLKSPVLSVIQVDEQKSGEKQTEKVADKYIDRMIEFNLQAIETIDDQSTLNKLIQEDKGDSVKPPAEAKPDKL